MVKHARISLMATNERPLSCSSCLVDSHSPLTSNSMSNLSAIRKSSVEEKSEKIPESRAEINSEDSMKILPRCSSAPELQLTACDHSEDPEKECQTPLIDLSERTKKIFSFRFNKSMSIDSPNVIKATLKQKLFQPNNRTGSFLSNILHPFLPPLPKTKVAKSSPPSSVTKPHLLLLHPPLTKTGCSSSNPTNVPLTIRTPSQSAEAKRRGVGFTRTTHHTVQPPPIPSLILPPTHKSTTPPSNNLSSTTTATLSTTTTARRQRHSIAGQMSFSKLWGFGGPGCGTGFGKKLQANASTNSLFSTAVISGSSSAPNLRDMIPNTSPSGG